MDRDDNLPDSDAFIAPPFTLTEREKAFLTRNVKAGVFTDLFEDKRYLLLLYKALHPEDASATEADLTNVTCRSVLANTLYNDLGFFVRNKLVILVEAQSTWSRAIVTRLFLYLASTFLQEPIYREQTFPFICGESDVEMPDAELYVIYTGPRSKNMPEQLTWRKHVAPGRTTTWDFSVDVIYDGKEGDIINQYVSFCHITDEKRRQGGYTKETMMEIINECMKRGVLVDYLRSKTVETMLSLLRTPFEQEQIYLGMLERRERIGEERGEKRGEKRGEERGEKRGEERGEKRGIAIGERKKSIETAREMLAVGNLSVDTIVRCTKLSVAEVEALARGEEIQ